MERKLSDIDVLNIRAAHIKDHPKYGSKALAEMYCVSRSVIERLINRETYRHLPARLLPPTWSDVNEFVPEMVGVVEVEPLVIDGHVLSGGKRMAETGEIPDCFMRRDELERDGIPRGKWVPKDWTPPAEPPEKRLTLLEYEQEARHTRARITDIAAERRKGLGLEIARKRRKRRTKRQMEWAAKNVPKKGT
jgi:hypothetical protein